MNNQKQERRKTQTEVIDAEVLSGLENIKELPAQSEMQLVKYEASKPRAPSQLDQWLPRSYQKGEKNERSAKTIVIVNAFTGETQEIAITMGARPKDLLAQLTKFKLGKSTILRTQDGETFEMRDNLFTKVDEGTVLYAAQAAYAGESC